MLLTLSIFISWLRSWEIVAVVFCARVLTLYREWVLHCWPACLPYTVCTRQSFPAGCTTCSARRDICPSGQWLSPRWWSAPLSLELCPVYTLYSGLIALSLDSICSFHASLRLIYITCASAQTAEHGHGRKISSQFLEVGGIELFSVPAVFWPNATPSVWKEIGRLWTFTFACC